MDRASRKLGDSRVRWAGPVGDWYSRARWAGPVDWVTSHSPRANATWYMGLCVQEDLNSSRSLRTMLKAQQGSRPYFCYSVSLPIIILNWVRDAVGEMVSDRDCNSLLTLPVCALRTKHVNPRAVA